MATPGKINVDVDVHMVLPHYWTRQLNGLTVSLPIYTAWLEERNKKLDNKLCIRSAKLGQLRAEVRDYKSWTETLGMQVRYLGRQLQESRQQVDELQRKLRELEEKNSAAG